MCGCFCDITVEFPGAATADDGGDDEERDDECGNAYYGCCTGTRSGVKLVVEKHGV